MRIKAWYVKGIFSGDKKASFLGLVRGCGCKVSASVIQPAAVTERTLDTTAQAMLDFGRVADLGSHLSGQLGAQAHFAIGLAAFYIATGQDAACVAESAVGVTRMEPRGGAVFCSVPMPNILAGSACGVHVPGQPARQPEYSRAERIEHAG